MLERKKRMGSGRWLLCLLAWLASPVVAESIELELDSGALLSVERFGQGPDRLLWLPSEYGLHGATERKLAAETAQEGLEVWLVDLHGSYFLPPGRSSLDEVPREDIRDLIRAAQPQQGKLYLFSYGRGAALTLAAARRWQLSAKPAERPLGGALLLHPNLMNGTPRAGEEAAFLPITAGTNLPLFLFQPLNSAKRWYMPTLMAQLRQGGSDVFHQRLAGVSDGFQVRDDATEYERQVRQRLPQQLHTAMRLLDPYNAVKRNPVAALAEAKAGKAMTTGLQPVKGEPFAPPLRLTDMTGRSWTLDGLRGEVVLLNFWATWCPPCVEEIPSLGRLAERLQGRDFRVVSVNVGEEAEVVEAFLQRVPAAFPVLLDPDGSTTEPWKVSAFPTTYLIDRQGRVRYGYFGGLAWDADAVVERIEPLLNEPGPVRASHSTE